MCHLLYNSQGPFTLKGAPGGLQVEKQRGPQGGTVCQEQSWKWHPGPWMFLA